MNLRWKLDREVDAGVLELRSLEAGEALEFGVEVMLPGDDFATFILHFDSDGRMVELEVFGVTRHMPSKFQEPAEDQ